MTSFRGTSGGRRGGTRAGAAVGALAAAGLGALAYGTLIERRWYALRHATAPVLRPEAERPLRVLHLSDLHLLPGQEDRKRFVRRCLDLGPDLVVGTGDFLGGPDAIDEAVELLAPAARERPCLAVLGSNDFMGPVPKNPLHYFTKPQRRLAGERLDTYRLISGLESGGWRVLDNARTCVDTPAGRLDVVGLGDPHIHYDRPENVDWSSPSGPVALRLGIVHAPYLRSLHIFERRGFDLVMAGHTHGGQVRVPLVGALTTNCDLPAWRSRGLTREGDGPWLHVSAGLGHSRYAPFRFACRPEATLLDLVQAPPQG